MMVWCARCAARSIRQRVSRCFGSGKPPMTRYVAASRAIVAWPFSLDDHLERRAIFLRSREQAVELGAIGEVAADLHGMCTIMVNARPKPIADDPHGVKNFTGRILDHLHHGMVCASEA